MPYGKFKKVYPVREAKPAPRVPSLLAAVRESQKEIDWVLRNSAAGRTANARSQAPLHETVKALQERLAPDHPAQVVLAKVRAKGTALDEGDRLIIEQLRKDYT
ncbi:MAG TPA: hypothetical protein VMD09_12765 [Solirubrobacteraceae bacterium]|nr:hypothetical protein [Solirubrobacteraceae bacterium]